MSPDTVKKSVDQNITSHMTETITRKKDWFFIETISILNVFGSSMQRLWKKRLQYTIFVLSTEHIWLQVTWSGRMRNCFERLQHSLHILRSLAGSGVFQHRRIANLLWTTTSNKNNIANLLWTWCVLQVVVHSQGSWIGDAKWKSYGIHMCKLDILNIERRCFVLNRSDTCSANSSLQYDWYYSTYFCYEDGVGRSNSSLDPPHNIYHKGWNPSQGSFRIRHNESMSLKALGGTAHSNTCCRTEWWGRIYSADPE